MDDVKSYIEEHYVEEDLTLNQLAAHVNFSPNHFSTIFSQQTGQPFIKYLTDFRMNKAKELLRCTGKRAARSDWRSDIRILIISQPCSVKRRE